ncbi:unnamed protein product [Strongylus vulgaris]|uniref:Uncharacterized protein n=1 Tax=Strongylus vulgaris TaxID=40348 RepID=A0A3P7ID48_STRVU|nr:unnamed protein product [Strongylus vulgaris]
MLGNICLNAELIFPVCEKPLTYEMELDNFPKEELKELIWMEAKHHHNRLREQEEKTSEQ